MKWQDSFGILIDKTNLWILLKDAGNFSIPLCEINTANRKEKYEKTEFDFPGFTFRSLFVKNWKGHFFMSFLPAISKKAEKSVRDEIRSWKIHRRTGSDRKNYQSYSNLV